MNDFDRPDHIFPANLEVFGDNIIFFGAQVVHVAVKDFFDKNFIFFSNISQLKKKTFF